MHFVSSLIGVNRRVGWAGQLDSQNIITARHFHNNPINRCLRTYRHNATCMWHMINRQKSLFHSASPANSRGHGDTCPTHLQHLSCTCFDSEFYIAVSSSLNNSFEIWSFGGNYQERPTEREFHKTTDNTNLEHS